MSDTPPRRPAWVKAAIDREDRRRMRQNMVAGLAVVALLVIGYWLVETFAESRRLVLCLEAGHRNCARQPPEIEAIRARP